MLVLSRKVNERILIGDDVVITVVDVQGQKIRIGIEAPKALPIVREELRRRETSYVLPVSIAEEGECDWRYSRRRRTPGWLESGVRR